MASSVLLVLLPRLLLLLLCSLLQSLLSSLSLHAPLPAPAPATELKLLGLACEVTTDNLLFLLLN